MPHAPLISKIRCHSPNKNKSRVCNRNYLVYIGTREGVDLTPIENQIEKLNENNISEEAANDLYLKYIAERPNSNGLFGNIDCTDINRLGNHLADLTASGKNIYRGIVSLKEIDAVELGFNSKENWINYMNTVMPDIGKQFNIPIEKLAWSAAVHMEKGHPHCHYMFWRTDDKVQSNYIHYTVQNKCRELLSKEMFQVERELLVIDKTLSRDLLLDLGKNTTSNEVDTILKSLSGIPSKIPNKLHQEELNEISSKILTLLQALPNKGRINYAFLQQPQKDQVDNIVKILLSRPDFEKEYDKYLYTVSKISDTYSSGKQQKDYTIKNANKDLKKRLANIVITSIKNLRNELSTIEKSNQENAYKQMLQEQAITNASYGLFRSLFSVLENTTKETQNNYVLNKQSTIQSKRMAFTEAKRNNGSHEHSQD